MFSEIINNLRDSLLPDLDKLRLRFSAALTKKEGVVKLPYHFWTSDQKINPSTKHLLWMAIILEDCEAFKFVEGIALWEISQSCSANNPDHKLISNEHEKLINEFLDEFLSLASNNEFLAKLKNKLNSTRLN